MIRRRLSGFGPFVPDADVIFFQIGGIRFAFDEPKQFMNDALQMHFLCGDQWKSFRKIETHLVSEAADRTGACTVGF